MLSKTIEEILKGDDPWRYATFEGAVQLQLKIDARTSLAEELEWLQQAGRLARRLKNQANGLDLDAISYQPRRDRSAAGSSDESKRAEAAPDAELGC
jgi:hypothetical protein